eukprot:scaffold335967_cov34-Prasinocladus_malaysianus.AAC.1
MAERRLAMTPCLEKIKFRSPGRSCTNTSTNTVSWRRRRQCQPSGYRSHKDAWRCAVAVPLASLSCINIICQYVFRQAARGHMGSAVRITDIRPYVYQ